MEFTAEIALEATEPLTEDQLFQVAAIGGVAEGSPGQRRVEATFTVCASSFGEATEAAIHRVLAVLPGEVVSVEIMTTEEQDRRLGLRDQR